jgi:NTP pyrophosphatase (non-canonical NTP hydrolase)
MEQVTLDLEDFIDECAEFSRTHGFDYTWEDAPRALMLIVTELAEAMEAWRDDNREEFEVELADVFIRLMHMVSQLDLKDTFLVTVRKKMDYNHKRPYRHGRKRI